MLKEKSQTLTDEVNLLKGKLEKAQRAIDQHKDVAAAAEESMKQVSCNFCGSWRRYLHKVIIFVENLIKMDVWHIIALWIPSLI